MRPESFTADIDFAFEPDPDNAHRLYQVLAEFWGGEVPAVSSDVELQEVGMVFQFGPADRKTWMTSPISRPPAIADLVLNISLA